MTAEESIAFAIVWFEAGQCPGCFTALPAIDASGDRHYRDGRPFQYGHGGTPTGDLCSVSGDDLYSLCLIGSGIVKYDRGTGGTNRPPAGETAPSRETAPTRLLR